MRRTTANSELARLRGYRTRPERDLSVAADLDRLVKDATRRSKAVGGIGRAWDATVPEALRARSAIVTYRAGVLTVRCADAAARFGLDRFLRSGGEAEVARLAPAALKRIKLT